MTAADLPVPTESPAQQLARFQRRAICMKLAAVASLQRLIRCAQPFECPRAFAGTVWMLQVTKPNGALP